MMEEKMDKIFDKYQVVYYRNSIKKELTELFEAEFERRYKNQRILEEKLRHDAFIDSIEDKRRTE